MEGKNIDPSYKEEVSEMSEASIQELCIKFYLSITNTKSKTYKKSRKCIVYHKLSIAYCGCCNKAFCYSVGGKKYNRTCLINHMKIIKQNNICKRMRSTAI